MSSAGRGRGVPGTRLEAVQAELGPAGLDALLVTDLVNVRWLTGFSGSAGRVLVRPEGPALLATDDRYATRAAGEAPAAELVLDRTWGWLLERRVRRLGVEAEHLPWGTVRDLDGMLAGAALLPTSGLISAHRQVKDPAEVDALRRACAITGDAFTKALGWLGAGMTERAVARRLVDTMLDLGADGSAFPPIVAAGANGAVPHHAPGDRALEVGDMVTMDFGALVDGYHADMTRTVAIGMASVDQRRIHDLVREAQEAGVEAVADGVGTAEVDRACRSLIAGAGHGEDFRHGTGHGVGLEIHEDPFLGATTAGTLATGMTVTVEPGVYLPGFGGVRIEDVVLVDGTGAERLTTVPHELLIL